MTIMMTFYIPEISPCLVEWIILTLHCHGLCVSNFFKVLIIVLIYISLEWGKSIKKEGGLIKQQWTGGQVLGRGGAAFLLYSPKRQAFLEISRSS